MSLIRLLQAASQGRRDVSLATFDERQGRWAIETGLGPLLAYTTATDPQAAISPLWPAVQGTALLSRLQTAEQFAAMDELLEACEGQVPPLTILKGISIADQHYPVAHLRPMRDIDILVDAKTLPIVAALLHTLGYRQQSHRSPEFYDSHHHLMPFVHPQRGIWIEVHRGLFPPGGHLGAEPIFGLDRFTAQLQPSTFHGRTVMRLTDAFQLVYIAAHWAYELPGLGGTVALLDVIYLLKNSRHVLGGESIVDWLQGSSVAAAYVYLLLTYMARYHLIDIPSEMLRALARRQQAFGALNLHLIHRLLDRYVVDGHPHGRVCNAHHLEIIWKTLLQPGHPWGNFLRVPWNLFLGSRLGAGLLAHQHLPAEGGTWGKR